MEESWRMKCAYLQDQVMTLRSELQDMETVVKLNKDALKMCQAEGVMAQGKAADIILKHILQENDILYKQLEEMRQQRDQAIDRAFINEQISEGLEMQEKFNQEQLQEQNARLRRCLKDKEEQIAAFKKDNSHGALIYIDKLVYQKSNQQIVQPSEANLRWSNQTQQQNQVLIKYYYQIHELMEQKDEIVRLNFTLSNEVLRLQNSYHSPKPSSHGRSNIFFSNKEDPNKFIQNLVRLQRRILMDDSGDEQEQSSTVFSPIFSPLPAKVKPPQKVSSNHKHIATEVEDADLPKLDLAKAQQIQQYNLHRIQLMMASKNHESKSITELDEKIQKLVAELTSIRNKYSSMIVMSQYLELNISFMRAQIQDLQSVNETLIKSNQNYEKKWDKIRNQYQVYKAFFELRNSTNSNIDFTTTRRQHDLTTFKTSFDENRISRHYPSQSEMSIMQVPDDLPLPSPETQKTVLLNIAQEVYRLATRFTESSSIKRSRTKWRSQSANC